jgi:hypothetical protein
MDAKSSSISALQYRKNRGIVVMNQLLPIQEAFVECCLGKTPIYQEITPDFGDGFFTYRDEL